jgi:hypothetical protein
MVARRQRAMCSMVRRYAARGVSSWPVAAAVRHDGSRVVALQRAVRPVAVVRRSAGLHAEPWLDAVVREPHGTSARQVAPWPEVPLGGPSPVVVPLDGPWQVVLLDGLLAQPRHLGHDLFPVGRTSRCSPQSRRHQEKMLQRERMAKA